MEHTPRQLDINDKQKTQYCVPLWLRDEQIRQNSARITERLEPSDQTYTEPIAIVGFAPSLRETWEQIKDYKYTMTCSGAHKFLVDRGIIPTWHVEVDPRAHKVGLMGPPQKETQYLIASACHKALLDHLEGFNVKLWHVFDPSDEGIRRLPPGEWALTGGCDVGLRTLTIAAFIGFRELHIFGMDHSAGTVDAPTGQRHADFHPNGGKKFDIVEYDGVQYYTTPAMLEAARSTRRELSLMPKVKATFFGDGLVQHMLRDWSPEAIADEDKPLVNAIAATRPVLISAEYAALNSQLHEQNLGYGVGGGKHAETVLKLCERVKTTSVLDYGCGKGYLAKALPFPIWEYDPAIPGKEESPRPADVVVCTDVLEHIEPDKLFAVLMDLKRCVRQVGFFVIHTGPAGKTLPDGRNTHLIQQDRDWWHKKLKKFFTIGRSYKVGPEVWFVVAPR